MTSGPIWVQTDHAYFDPPERIGIPLVPLVSFEGNWSDEETILIENAAEVAEANFRRPNPDGLESPWIAVSHDVDGEKFYAASRYQQPGVLRAKAPEALAEKITNSGVRGEASPDD